MLDTARYGTLETLPVPPDFVCRLPDNYSCRLKSRNEPPCLAGILCDRHSVRASRLEDEKGVAPTSLNLGSGRLGSARYSLAHLAYGIGDTLVRVTIE